MNNKLEKYYDNKFYEGSLAGSGLSAQHILGILYQIYKPSSVIDFGCGRGSWLAVAESLGSSKLKGIDGHWVSAEDILSEKIDFSPVNFEQKLDVSGKYDLCMSLEVAEHLNEIQAEPFIKTLCSVSDVVLFSAAIQHQGGAGHINEQWQSYWIKLFESNAYQCFDIFRSSVWENPEVAWWYRQNTFLFVKTGSDVINFEKLSQLQKPIFNVVHPMNYEGKWKNSLSIFKKIRNKLRQLKK